MKKAKIGDNTWKDGGINQRGSIVKPVLWTDTEAGWSNSSSIPRWDFFSKHSHTHI